MSPVITFPFSCLDCKAVSRFSTREIESASRIRCTACGSISLERKAQTGDEARAELTSLPRNKRRAKTHPDKRTRLLSAPTRYREVVLKNQYARFQAARTKRKKSEKEADFTPLQDR